LSRGKGLRGTAFDPFGRTEARKLERELIGWYRGLITEAVEGLDDSTYAIAVELARLPEEIRGYEHIKTTAVAAARRRAEALLAQRRRT
jgi:indolepyruvate ferredoxin oxidoreductase